MCRILISTTIVVLLAASAAAAQATRPVPTGWAKTVSDFSAAVNSGDEDAARLLLAPQAEIRTFAGNSSFKSLIEYSSAATLLGSHAYVHPSLSIAADLAADVAASDVVPPDAKNALAIDSKNAATAADTAVKWVARVLGADDASFVGMIPLWNPHDNSGADSSHPVFVLIKGTRSDSGKFLISKVVFGDPL